MRQCSGSISGCKAMRRNHQETHRYSCRGGPLFPTLPETEPGPEGPRSASYKAVGALPRSASYSPAKTEQIERATFSAPLWAFFAGLRLVAHQFFSACVRG